MMRRGGAILSPLAGGALSLAGLPVTINPVLDRQATIKTKLNELDPLPTGQPLTLALHPG